MMECLYMGNMMILSGFMVFVLNRKHFLVMLLSLEFLVISLYLMMSLFINLFNFEGFFLMIFLTMSVCEGALGLSILVVLIRSFGNDYVKSLFFLW